MSAQSGAIVIGAGHNGLIAAAMLARRGIKPLVLESRSHIGGMLGDATFRIAPMPFALRPQICAALGFELNATPMTTIVLGASEVPVRISGSRVEGVPERTAAAYAALAQRLERQAAALSAMLLNPPPRFSGMGLPELLRYGGTALQLRRLGGNDLRDLMRIALSNVHDLVDDELGDGPLGVALAMDATLGNAMGPRSPGTVLTLLYRFVSNGGRRFMPAGGPGAVVEALERAVMTAGGEIRVGAGVEQILVEHDKVAGIRLADGAVIATDLVLSSAAPRSTLLDLLGAEHLDAEFVRRCRLMASSGMVARLDFQLDHAPRLADGTELAATDRVVIAQSMQHIERTFDKAKYGAIPEEPVLEAHFDPQSKRLSVSAQYVPSAPEGGWTDSQCEMLEQRVRETLAACLPGFAAISGSCNVMTPADIERGYRVAGGHWHHGELRVDQMLMLRPFEDAAHYRMPVEGLYLCGAGTHPGGDISGAPGFNAANAALAERVG